MKPGLGLQRLLNLTFERKPVENPKENYLMSFFKGLNNHGLTLIHKEQAIYKKKMFQNCFTS